MFSAYLGRFGPSTLGGPLAANVPDIWQHTPAPYGPVFLGLAAAVTGVTGDHAVLGALGMRAVALAGVALLAWGVPELARHCGVDPAAALWLGVLNPLVLDHLVAGAHNDAVMLGLLVAGLVALVRWLPVVGVALITTAAMVKAPAALALAFVVPLWAAQLPGAQSRTKAALGTGAVALGTAVLVTAASGRGYGWTSALGTPAVVRNWMSITTDLGHLTGAVPTFRALGLAVAGTVAAALIVGRGGAPPPTRPPPSPPSAWPSSRSCCSAPSYTRGICSGAWSRWPRPPDGRTARARCAHCP
ncbi:polyprenol phosphomannose-dependent alpha 1,6 mannosyltransferase MptB [Luedemannella flava]